MGSSTSGSDITITGGDLFKKIAAVARLKKNFRQPDKLPIAYNQQPFEQHGRMDLRIALGDRTTVTPREMPVTSCCCQREFVNNLISFGTTLKLRK